MRPLCREIWFPGHKCAGTVQLHVIEEVWDLLTPEEEVEVVPEPTEQLMMVLSSATWSSMEAATAPCIHDQIQQ